MYKNAGYRVAFGVSHVRTANIVPGIPERRTDTYRHVRMGVFSDRGFSDVDDPIVETMLWSK